MSTLQTILSFPKACMHPWTNWLNWGVMMVNVWPGDNMRYSHAMQDEYDDEDDDDKDHGWDEETVES